MLPQEFIRRTKELLHDEYYALETALETQPPVSVRINPHKLTAVSDINFPAGAFGEYKKIPWCENGYYLSKRPSFTFDPLFHAGAYYVQEASSMFLEQAFLTITADMPPLRKPLIALDLCAAPGGKSTHLLSLLREEGLLVSNEIIRNRSMILAENIIKWGRAGNITTNNDPRDFGKLKHVFDVILADLPCSGEGMFRKDPTARNEWSADNVKLCASRQKRIIHDVWEALKPGGWLIYSTCTFNTEENEDNICYLAEKLDAELVAVAVKPEWNIASSLHHDIPIYRFYPHRTCGEGFSLALMRKNKDTAKTDRIKTFKNNDRPTTVHPGIKPEIKRLLSTPDKFRFITAGANATAGADSIFAIPEALANIYAICAKMLNIVSAGIHMGRFKGKDFTPSVSLALCTEINPNAFIPFELSYENAIKYLQKEALILPENTPKGHLLATYKKTPLGFVKNIGNRANNRYPQEWRIRKSLF
ncbi:MAG: RsmB/NOP family class I SAM-dependent RNA methyltransferase [Tannerella sp.]|jgi:16S rRNA C967 or C1407 C5-methylase (RsmB/RsmF family)/NOL1/NOP2/fmu family ribosome biogenesis protein|nr:RsmB/NOP family class I SAM-dependent RNA methyltransferase [Tannerella sp.]